MKLSKWQKQTLELLIDKYERSKQYSDDPGNEFSRAIMIKPTDIYKNYDSDFADVDEQRDFESEMHALEQEKLIGTRMKDGILLRIELILASVSSIYTLLKREPLKDSIGKQIALYSKWLGKEKIIDEYCNSQIELLENGKKAKYDFSTAEKLLPLLEFVLNNEEVILERELSIAVFGDTKVFENGYRTKLIYILKTFGGFEEIISEIEDEKEATQIILEEFNVYSNPQYVYFKGNGTIEFDDGYSYKLTGDIPLSMTMSNLRRVISFEIEDSTIMTIENLASYNRINPKDCFCIYLAGYHNSARQSLIKMIYSQNSDKQWEHFGDLDPDGFLILENLRDKTGINFAPIYMGIPQLVEFSKYTKELQKNDIVKAEGLIKKGKCVEIMKYMLENNVKLEQEVISWMEK